jgi:hypothetical protein
MTSSVPPITLMAGRFASSGMTDHDRLSNSPLLLRVSERRGSSQRPQPGGVVSG